uniref:Protein kinase domain-containing protein n=1 Tax=Davidia involucrata TaxID=16924 RepID=A0A5B7ALL0_DAVIN
MLRRKKLLFAGSTAPQLLVLLLLLFSSLTCTTATAQQNHGCEPSSCGNIHNISYPFRLKGDPQNDCSHPSYELACENNRTVLSLYDYGKFYVEAITYENYSIRVVDPGLDKDNCSSFPLHSLNYYDFPYTTYSYLYSYNDPLVFISCTAHVNSTLYVDTAFCSKNTSSSNSALSSLQKTTSSSNYSTLSSLQNHSYVVSGDMFRLSDLEDSCTIGVTAWASSQGQSPREIIGSNSLSDIHDRLLYGFELSWYNAKCGDCEARSGICYQITIDHHNNTIICEIQNYCKFSNSSSSVRPMLCIRQILRGIRNGIRDNWMYDRKADQNIMGLFLAARFSCGIPFMLALLVYKFRRRHLSMYDTIEDFLQSHNNLVPIRYAFSDIKKMTNGFKDKLGEGGYGTVYKGKLRSGILVAVKMMGKSKATGQEFINEVGTIGRIHHVNVVQLIGFCAEGSKRALVYDFMPNGSLEKYIFPREEGTLSLSCEKMYEISLGVARGIHYLHRGCNMQILHFDIKPHNILLDQNFTPKVSDFGLAKLYPTDDSIVSLTAARGTMGYMAPELFYKNIGGVSYKADVYSFGMLLMEMAGRRKNLNAFADHFSQIYFPSWVYDQFNEGKDIEMGDATEEERKMVKKMIIVALWCIQMKPGDRPSMHEVIDMLEAENVEQLQMPPKPFLTPQEMPAENH